MLGERVSIFVKTVSDMLAFQTCETTLIRKILFSLVTYGLINFFMSLVHTSPEEFENGGLTPIAHQIFSVQTTPEKLYCDEI